MKVTSVRVQSFNTDCLDVFWEIDSNFDSVYDYRMFVERSESPEGPFEDIAGPFQDKYHVRDNSVPRMDKWSDLWYRIRIEKLLDGTLSYSTPGRRDTPMSMDAREMERSFRIILREWTGLRCILFPVRTFGPRCPECVDRITKRRQKERCLTCFNTGYVGGYLSPIQILLQEDPSIKTAQKSGTTTTQVRSTTARTVSYPPIKPGDLIIDPKNTRWKVNSLTEIARLAHVVRQELQMATCMVDSVEYKLPVNIADLENYLPVPVRAICNVKNTDALDCNLSDLGKLYGDTL